MTAAQQSSHQGGKHQDNVGSLDTALNHTANLLNTDPAMAAEQAGEIIKAVGDHPVAKLLLAIAKRLTGNAEESLELLVSLTQSQPNWADAHFQYSLTLGAQGQGDAALVSLRVALKLKPDLTEGWRVLADHLRATGDNDGADQAYANHIKYSSQDPKLMAAATALCEKRIAEAESLLRRHLHEAPTDVAAIRMLAEVAARLGRHDDAEHLLERCLDLAPGFVAARQNYALVLQRANKASEALKEIDRLLAIDSRNPSYRNLRAIVLSRIGEYDEAIDIFAEVLGEYPQNAKVWLSYGHALKTAGRQETSIEAYKKCIELEPVFGEAYWSLANLKTFRFSDDDLDEMKRQLSTADLADEHRYHFDFSLGKALEDSGNYAESFQHYQQGNQLRRKGIPYSAKETSARVLRSKTTFSRDFFAGRTGFGSQAQDPIFIVGLPRAGSTLIEQILSSHSAVEGTMELPEIISMTKALRDQADEQGADSYHAVLAELSADKLRDLGQQFLDRTRIQRKTDTPFFIDKMPNNFAHVGLIHLMLPNAKIIDARRHPMACCFSGFKQHFARGQNFTYSLEEIGRYYRDYVELMAHFDEVLPGRVHRVIYEQMVDDTESEVRRLLDYCGLPFEEQCLRFFENDRPVRTASSEQVRQPIYRDGVDQWRHYEQWLNPLKESLGDVLESYPEVPAF